MADYSEYHSIDTRVFDNCINKKDSFISRYSEIVTDYDKIVNELAQSWAGLGADAFFTDATQIRRNITGIADILATMCATLEDCREVIADCDKSLGDFNRDPGAEQ